MKNDNAYKYRWTSKQVNLGDAFYQFIGTRIFAGAGYEKGGIWVVGSNRAAGGDARDAVDPRFDLDLYF